MIRNRLSRSVLWIAALFALACPACVRANDKGESKDGFGRLTADEVEKMLGRPDVFVYDNNPPEVYKQGHVPGAKWLKYNDVKPSDLPADKDATLIFYCANEH